MSLYDIPVSRLDGTETTLGEYRGRVLLIVNVASKCGFTSQYAGLEALYRKYRDAGLTVFGFPCNQFLGQEPGDAAAIGQFCSLTYDVTFPVFAKVKVNGADAHPLYRFLKSERRGTLGSSAIKWNFSKFLVGRDGTVEARFGPIASPASLEPAIERLLASRAAHE
jgi:glutathione peroxidase